MSLQAPTPDSGIALEPLPIPYERLGRPIAGPKAITGGARRFWHLTFNLAVQQWKLRFFGSALGYVWQLVRPLLLFLVLYIFFTKVSDVDATGVASEAHEGAQLLASIVLFTFFTEATTSSVRCVVDSEALVRKVQFPRMVIPLSVVLLACFNLGLNLVVVTIFTLASGVLPMWTWFELIPIIAMLVVLCAGIAMLLSAGFVYFRDLQPIWDVVSQVIFYASPIILPITEIKDKISPTLLHIYMLNPLAVIFQQFRHVFVTHATPSAGALLGSMTQLLEPIGITLIIFALGFYVFNRVAPKVAEDL